MPGNHLFEFGLAGLNDEVRFVEDSFAININNRIKKLNRVSGYLQDVFHPAEMFEIKCGVRFDYAFDFAKLWFQQQFLFHY